MQPLLLLLCLGLIAALRAQDPLALDEGDQDLSGTWYVKAVTTNMDKPERKPDSVGPITIVTQDGGNLEVSLSFLIKGQCHTLDAVLEKTEEPGRYTAFGGRSVAQVTPLKEKDHFVMVCEGVMHGKAFRHFKLLGREPETNPAALEEFQKVARAKGFTTEDIVIPRLGESCTPETD